MKSVWKMFLVAMLIFALAPNARATDFQISGDLTVMPSGYATSPDTLWAVGNVYLPVEIEQNTTSTITIWWVGRYKQYETSAWVELQQRYQVYEGILSLSHYFGPQWHIHQPSPISYFGLQRLITSTGGPAAVYAADYCYKLYHRYDCAPTDPLAMYSGCTACFSADGSGWTGVIVMPPGGGEDR